MKADTYQVITDRIVGLLEQGTVPWHKPWRGGNMLPQNLVNRKPYRAGIPQGGGECDIAIWRSNFYGRRAAPARGPALAAPRT